MKVIGEPDRGKPYVRFDEGVLAARVWRTYTGTKPETADTAKGSLQLGLPGSTLPNPQKKCRLARMDLQRVIEVREMDCAGPCFALSHC